MGSGQVWSYLSVLHCWGRLCRSRLDLSPLCVCSTNLPTKAMKPAQQTIQPTHVTWRKQNCYVKTFAFSPPFQNVHLWIPAHHLSCSCEWWWIASGLFLLSTNDEQSYLRRQQVHFNTDTFLLYKIHFLLYMKVYWIITSYLCLSHNLHPKYTS